MRKRFLEHSELQYTVRIRRRIYAVLARQDHFTLVQMTTILVSTVHVVVPNWKESLNGPTSCSLMLTTYLTPSQKRKQSHHLVSHVHIRQASDFFWSRFIHKDSQMMYVSACASRLFTAGHVGFIPCTMCTWWGCEVQTPWYMRTNEHMACLRVNGPTGSYMYT
jgi:hypothetical protein